MLIEQREKKNIHLDGCIELGDEHFYTQKKARCSFDISTNWVQKIPIVICRESWVIRKPPEWHVYEDGNLCFEFELNWGYKLSAMVDKYTHGLAAEYATKWLLSSTRSLLNRHLFAVRAGIKSWNADWNYWPHGHDDASKEFLRTETKGLAKNNF